MSDLRAAFIEAAEQYTADRAITRTEAEQRQHEKAEREQRASDALAELIRTRLAEGDDSLGESLNLN